MKKLYIIACVLFLSVSCGTEKDATSTTTITGQRTSKETPEVIEDQLEGESFNMNGVVRDKSAEGCGFVIEVMVSNAPINTKLYNPLELPREYQVDGMEIRIEARYSRRPSTCEISTPIIIDKILD